MNTHPDRLDEISRRGFLAGLAGFAAMSALPVPVVRALATPQGIQELTASDVSDLLQAIRAYLPPYDQEDHTDTFDRWEKMAQALKMPDEDLDAADKLDQLLRQYRRNPEAASAWLLRHLQQHAVDLTDVRSQTISQWDDVETVRQRNRLSDEDIQWLRQQIAADRARWQQERQPSIGQAQTAAAVTTSFRDLLQRVMSAGTDTAAPPREKYMGRIEPTSTAPALPAPDKTAAEIMRDLQDRLDRSLTDSEREVVQQTVDAAQTRAKS